MMRFKFYLSLLILTAVSTAFGQVLNYKPSDFRGDQNYRRFSNIDGNNIRATIFNSGYSGNPNGQANYIDYEWPKNTGRIYIALISFWASGEGVDNNGNIEHLVEMPVYKTDPGGNSWNFEPVPGFINPQQQEIARSDNKNSWPQDFQGGWRDKRTDPLDPGWPGSWDGYFGKNIFNADQEFYFVTSDDYPIMLSKITGNPDTVCPHFVAQDFTSKALRPGDKIVLIEPNTYDRIITTYPAGGGKVFSLGKEYDLPAGGITVAEDTVANGYDDNFNGLIDERASIHLNHINQITGVVKPVRYINYLYFPAGDTIKRGFVVPGTNAAWNYQNVAPMIDESRDDGFDNDGDWDIVLDDVGLDGVPHTGDFGEGDGKPTSGAGTEFPGEPGIDKTDVRESDQLGI